MTSPATLLLITSAPYTHAAKTALDTATTYLSQDKPLVVFFYGDGAHTANALSWQSADVPQVRDGWVQLASDYGLDLPVCVSTALARGITDSENAMRHSLMMNGAPADNLAAPFRLVGLSELALMMDDDVIVRQF